MLLQWALVFFIIDKLVSWIFLVSTWLREEMY